MLVNRDLGITEEDIKSCEDREQLKEWKREMCEKKAQVSDMLLQEDIRRDQGKYVNEDRYRRAKGYRTILILSMEMIDNMSTKLNAARLKSRDRMLINIFKLLSSKKTISRAYEMLKAKKS